MSKFEKDLEILKAMNTIVTNMIDYEDEDSGLYDYWAMEAIPDEPTEQDFIDIVEDKEMLKHVTQVFIACCKRLKHGMYLPDNNMYVEMYKGQ